MPRSLIDYCHELLSDRAKLLARLTSPLLVWKAPPTEASELLFGTQVGLATGRPTAGAPLVFEVQKQAGKPNAFAMGITVGRTPNNDIALEDNSVSRFHAYLTQELKTKAWQLVDAESTYGTFVDGAKLSPNVASAVPDRARLKFGEVEVQYFLPDAFLEFLQEEMRG